MLVPLPGAATPNFIRLGSHVLSELLHEPFKFHPPLPFLTFKGIGSLNVRVQIPRPLLPSLQTLGGFESSQPLTSSNFLKDGAGLLRAVAQQVRGSRNPHVPPRVPEQDGKGIPASIALRTELFECGYVPLGVLVASPGICSEDRIRLCSHVLSELLNEFFNLRHQIPLVTFSMASKPNWRCAS